MERIRARRWKQLCESVVLLGNHPETWNRAAALAEVDWRSALDLFLDAWNRTHCKH